MTVAEKLMRIANDPSATPAEREAYRRKATELRDPHTGEFYYIVVTRYKSREDFDRNAKVFERATTSGNTIASSIAAMGEFYHWEER